MSVRFVGINLATSFGFQLSMNRHCIRKCKANGVCVTVHLWYNRVPPQPCHRQAASSVHYTTSCKHSLVLLRKGEIFARNMLSWFKLLINCYCCIYLVGYTIVLKLYNCNIWSVKVEASVLLHIYIYIYVCVCVCVYVYKMSVIKI